MPLVASNNNDSKYDWLLEKFAFVSFLFKNFFCKWSLLIVQEPMQASRHRFWLERNFKIDENNLIQFLMLSTLWNLKFFDAGYVINSFKSAWGFHHRLYSNLFRRAQAMNEMFLINYVSLFAALMMREENKRRQLKGRTHHWFIGDLAKLTELR